MSNQGPQHSTDLTSNQLLARDIAEQLVKEGLIAKSKLDELELGLAEGNLSAETWRLFVEITVDRENRLP